MNLVTICTGDQPWLTHLERWFRYARLRCPKAKLHLLYAGDPRVTTQGVIKEFDEVKVYDGSVATRPWFNEVRMDATEIFGVKEMVYIDADCDIMGDLSGVVGETEKDLGWCRSPWCHPRWTVLSDEMGYGRGEWSANNGFLLMRRSFKEEYAKARKKIEEEQKKSRIGGILVFNVMLRMYPELAEELPYEYSVIRSDYGTPQGIEALENAYTIQYCNQINQALRLNLETDWRRSL